MAKAHVLFADSFEKAYQALDATIQRLVVDFMLKLRREPDSHGLNLKQPNNTKDKRVWTARVNDNFRAVLLRPDRETFYLASIKPHDDAYVYASRIVWDINKVTGGVEFYDHGAVEEIIARTHSEGPASSESAGLFAGVSDKDFTRLGVTAALLPVLREIHSIDALLGISEHVPTLTAQVILALHDRVSVEDVYADIVAGSETEEHIDPDDYKAAAQRPATQQTFALVTGDSEELERMLLKPMSEWRVFLHPEQRKLAYRTTPNRGPVRVSGGPGTGKTVVALHRAKALAATVPSGTPSNILLTTYSNTLNDLLSRLLDDLGGPELTAKVQVRNIDKVVRDILSQDKEWAKVEVIGDSMLKERWDDIVAEAGPANRFDTQFLIGEWEQVVLAQDLRTREQYFAARRAGRGRRLTRAERAEVWHLIQEFERRLDRDRMLGFKQAALRATDITAQWTDADRPYRHIVVDEAQDMHAAHWRLLRSLAPTAPDDLFIVGDTFQRIYDNRVSLASLGIDVRGRSRRLTLNYRTTRQILGTALTMLGDEPFDDLDDGTETLRGYRSALQGARPVVQGFPTSAAELANLSEQVREWHAAGVPLDEIAVIARTNPLTAQAVTALTNSGIKATHLKSGQPPRADSGVLAMTMHRAKGLEFRAVAIIGASADRVPAEFATTPATIDHLEHQRQLQRERSLLFVSATRARDSLAVSWTGQPSRFLQHRDE